MSRLRVFAEDRPGTPLLVLEDAAAIARALDLVGVRFEQWRAAAPVAPGAGAEAILAAYRDDVARIMRDGGYQSADVISLAPDHPDAAALRGKFLAEHTHVEDEVRFFVAGTGLFTLHIGGQVYEVRCERGDLIGVPDGTRHWFDMGPRPDFVAIRFFGGKDGWVAHFTGSDIAGRFPRFEAGQAG